MASHPSERELGMHRNISRRDFLNGMAIGVGGLLAADPLLHAWMSTEFAPRKLQATIRQP